MVPSRLVPALLFALGALACSSSEDEEAPKVPEGPFAVSEFFYPTGAMGDGANALVTPSIDCKERPSGALGDCYAFDYVAGEALWAGLYWQYPRLNWGASAGLPVPGSKLTKVTFQAAVKEGTEEMIFVAGGIGIDPPEGSQIYPNTDQMKAEATFTVTTAWQPFELLLP